MCQFEWLNPFETIINIVMISSSSFYEQDATLAFIFYYILKGSEALLLLESNQARYHDIAS